MPDLLTAKDVELKIFKKVSFGGYAISDVEEFLNQIAEDLESYALNRSDLQRRINELEDALKRHEAMKDTIKDALILAQKSAKDKEDEAKQQAGQILAKAESQLTEIAQQGRRRIDEAKQQAEQVLAKAQVQADELVLQARRRIEEAENTADDIVAEGRAAAAQLLKSAESADAEAQKRIEKLEADIAQRMADANDKASDITASARLEARRVLGKTRNEVEELRKEVLSLHNERDQFLKSSGKLTDAFMRILEEAGKQTEKGGLPLSADAPDETALSHKRESARMTLSFSPVNDEADEEAIS